MLNKKNSTSVPKLVIINFVTFEKIQVCDFIVLCLQKNYFKLINLQTIKISIKQCL